MQEEKGMTEDEMVGWHHRLNGHELEQALGVGDGQGSLVCCSPWGCKESDMTEQLNNNHSAAAAAKSLQSCLTLCDPIDGNPPGSPVPGILQARIRDRAAICLKQQTGSKLEKENVKAVYCHSVYLTYAEYIT